MNIESSLKRGQIAAIMTTVNDITIIGLPQFSNGKLKVALQNTSSSVKWVIISKTHWGFAMLPLLLVLASQNPRNLNTMVGVAVVWPSGEAGAEPFMQQ